MQIFMFTIMGIMIGSLMGAVLMCVMQINRQFNNEDVVKEENENEKKDS